MVKKKTKSSHQHQSSTKRAKETLANKKLLFNIYKDLYVSEKRFQEEMKYFLEQLRNGVLQPTYPHDDSQLHEYVDELNKLVNSFVEIPFKLEELPSDLTTVSDTELDVAIGKLAKWGNRLTNSNFKNHMLHTVSMYDLQAEEFLQKLHEDGIKITLMDDLDASLREKSTDMRALEYFALLPRQRVQRYAFLGTEIKNSGGADIIREFGKSLSEEAERLIDEARMATPEASELQTEIKNFITQYKKQYRLAKSDIEALDKLQHKLDGVTGKKADKLESAYLQVLQIIYDYRDAESEKRTNRMTSTISAKTAVDQIERQLKERFLASQQNQDEWTRFVAIAKVTKLEKELRAQFSALAKNNQLTPALQNLQRTKDFIIYNVKHTPKIQEAQISAYLHELKGIQAALKHQKVANVQAAEPVVDHELVNKFSQLRQLIESGLRTITSSNKLSVDEQVQFDKLSEQINQILNLPQDVTSDELKVRVKKGMAAQIFIEKWLPEIAHRQSGSTAQMMTMTRATRDSNQSSQQMDALAQLNSLKQYLEAGFTKLLKSDVLTEKEKISILKLQTQVTPNFNVSEAATEEELQLKVKNLSAAKGLVEQVSRLAFSRRAKEGLFANRNRPAGDVDDAVHHHKRNDR